MSAAAGPAAREGAAARAARAGRRPVVAVVGAGQLAQMTHQAAIGLGVEVRVLAGGPRDPAVLAGAVPVYGRADRLEDLRALAAGADVVSFDHEAIPTAWLRQLEADGVALAPSPAAKQLAQDKHHARVVLGELGLPVPPFALARTEVDVERFAAGHPWPLVGKVPRGGYDGRGVLALEDRAAAARELLGHPDGLVLEPRLAIDCELSVLVARSTRGEVVAYPVVETVQEDAMCREVLAPARAEPGLLADARELALGLAERRDVTGLLAVELFVCGGELLVNELALRPHNSGHWTIEGAATSQFEQHLRAILGLPLGATELRAPAVAMVNVVGPPDGTDPADRLADGLAVHGAHVHLYGKAPRPGRKLGHVTALGEDVASARATARSAAAALEGKF